MNAGTPLDDLIPTREAARLKLSPRAERTSTSTIVRLIREGKVKGERRGFYWFVSRSSLLKYQGVKDTPMPPAVSERSRQAQVKAAYRSLRAMGLDVGRP